VSCLKKGNAHNQQNKRKTTQDVNIEERRAMRVIQIQNQKDLSYHMFRTENSLKPTKLRPIESYKNYTVNTENSYNTSEKCEATREKIFQMKRRECPRKQSDSDKIFPKDWPAKTRCKFPSLMKRQYPDKYPTDSACKSRTNNSPQFEKNIIGTEIECHTSK